VSGGNDARSGVDVTPGQALHGQPASLTRRLCTLVYEVLLLVAMALVVGFLFLPLVSPGGASRSTLTIPPIFVRTMMFCALASGGAAYYVWFWSEGRRTLPQKTWGLRLADVAGRNLTRRTALVRYAAGWIGPVAALAAYGVLRPVGAGRYAAALLLLNYAWALVDPARQFLHDRIADTRVVNALAAAKSAQ
jgi:uncharacterized RDD family membrane protein YckC